MKKFKKLTVHKVNFLHFAKLIDVKENDYKRVHIIFVSTRKKNEQSAFATYTFCE